MASDCLRVSRVAGVGVQLELDQEDDEPVVIRLDASRALELAHQIVEAALLGCPDGELEQLLDQFGADGIEGDELLGLLDHARKTPQPE